MTDGTCTCTQLGGGVLWAGPPCEAGSGIGMAGGHWRRSWGGGGILRKSRTHLSV